MKNIKWIIGVLLLVLVLTLSLGKNSTENTDNNEVLSVAALLPLTGPAAFPGKESQDGMLLALEEINNDTRKIELIIQDSKTKPAEGVSIINQLESTKKPDLYISALSSISMAIAPLAEQFDFPLLAIFTYASEFTDQNKNVFRFFPTAQKEIPLILENLRELESEKIGILHLNDDYGNTMANLLKEGLEDTEKIVFLESFNAPDQDVRTQLLKLKDNEVDSIYVVGFDSHIINGLTQSREIGYDGNLLASVALPQPVNLEMLDNDITEGVLSAYPKIDDDFKDKFFRTYNYSPGIYAANAYAAMYLIAENLIPKTDYSTDSIKDIFNNLPQNYPSVLGIIIPAGQEIPYKLYPVEIQNGEVIYK